MGVQRGDPGRNRTCDTEFRKLLLYPLSYGANRTSIGDHTGEREHGRSVPARWGFLTVEFGGREGSTVEASRIPPGEQEFLRCGLVFWDEYPMLVP